MTIETKIRKDLSTSRIAGILNVNLSESPIVFSEPSIPVESESFSALPEVQSEPVLPLDEVQKQKQELETYSSFLNTSLFSLLEQVAKISSPEDILRLDDVRSEFQTLSHKLSRAAQHLDELSGVSAASQPTVKKLYMGNADKVLQESHKLLRSQIDAQNEADRIEKPNLHSLVHKSTSPDTDTLTSIKKLFSEFALAVLSICPPAKHYVQEKLEESSKKTEEVKESFNLLNKTPKIMSLFASN